MERLQSARDISDSLRIEFSSLPPKRERALQELVVTSSAKIEDKYGRFIPDRTAASVRNLSLNTFASPNPNELANAWAGKNWMTYFDNLAADAANVVSVGREIDIDGNHYVFTEDPDSAWGRLHINDRKRLTKMFGAEEAARRAYGTTIFTKILVHELAHAYQDHSLPKEFKEVSAEYVMVQITGIPTNRPEVLDFFNDLLRKYGDNVYKVIFGSFVNPITKLRILRELNTQRYRGIMTEHAEQSDATRHAILDLESRIRSRKK